MADTIKIRAGNKANMPILGERELGYCKDENAFYIGTGFGNKRVGGLTDEEKAEIVQAVLAEIQAE